MKALSIHGNYIMDIINGNKTIEYENINSIYSNNGAGILNLGIIEMKGGKINKNHSIANGGGIDNLGK